MIHRILLSAAFACLISIGGCGGDSGGPVVDDASEIEQYTTPENVDLEAESSPS